MKIVVWSLIMFLTIVSVSAAYVPSPNALFEFKKGNCTENGTLTFEVTHEGVNVEFVHLNITVESEELSVMPLKGQWFYPDNYPAENYTGVDFIGKTRFKFRSFPSMFTKGKYKIDFRWPSNTVYNENIQFAIECPGIKCSRNDDCISQQACKNNVCEWLKCSEDKIAMGHTCLAKCNDYNPCTNDYFVDNQCVFIKINNCPKQEETIETNIFVRFWNWLKSRYK